MLPGIGADHHLFIPQLKAFEDSTVPRWVDLGASDESLESYALRQLAMLRSEGQLEGRFAFVGFSFGAQVAIEMTLRLIADGEALPTGLVLLSACRSREAVLPRFRRQVRLGGLVPGFIARPIFSVLGNRFASKHGLDAQSRLWMREMVRTLDFGHVKWAGRATCAWTRTRDEVSAIEGAGVSVHQVHGRNDGVIPLVDGDADEVLEDGLHLITWTHAGRVNDAIRRTTGAA